MAVRIRDNADQFLKGYDKLVPRRKRHTLDLIAGMEYAEPLHNRHGLYVYNVQYSAEIVAQWIVDTFDAHNGLSDHLMFKALDGGGFEALNFHRGYTDEMRPPVREGEGMRRAHPGGWSDVTGNLKASMRHEVNGKRGRSDYTA